MGILGFIIVGALIVYTTLCIWVPEIRVFYWRGAGGPKFGTLSYIGFAMFFWSAWIAHLEIIPEEHRFKAYLVVLLIFVVALIGYLIDQSSQS
jgi:hypothetical protein